jgi:cytochrome c
MRVAIMAGVALFGAIPAAAQDAERGRTLFQRQCASCHQVAQPRNGAGPHLMGIAGRAAASVEGFSYSPALRAAGLTWNGPELDAFLANPQEKVRGTRQPIRVANDADRGDLVAYLGSLPAP